ncbi:hypothetical protein D4100_04005 [Serratia inhibens]|uniref:Uncharacterized protein n=1 Tax=Serratia inhibens TaxID=2338073 RepID=A0AA93BX86_9GAMM|nr:hypothetical protein D4100_04005 [Serratia inhibens]
MGASRVDDQFWALPRAPEILAAKVVGERFTGFLPGQRPGFSADCGVPCDPYAAVLCAVPTRYKGFHSNCDAVRKLKRVQERRHALCHKIGRRSEALVTPGQAPAWAQALG